LKPLEFSSPTSLDEALGLLAKQGGNAGILSGGTDLIIQYRGGRTSFGHMIDIKRIPELNVLSFDPAQGLRLGAAVACDTLGAYRPAREHYPGLVEAAELIGSTQIQSRATVGGNVCNGSPAADTICPLIVLDATCLVRGAKGEREVAAGDFMTGPGETVLEPGELLVEFRLPPRPPRGSDAYLRFIPRKPLLVEAAGAVLTGSALDDAALEAAGKACSAAARPIDDIRGTAEYRVHMAGVLTRRAIKIATERAGEVS
jgi:carbon-monoxide dehydrogenase medium subunit